LKDVENLTYKERKEVYSYINKYNRGNKKGKRKG
jgi:hypothetical protein